MGRHIEHKSASFGSGSIVGLSSIAASTLICKTVLLSDHVPRNIDDQITGRSTCFVRTVGGSNPNCNSEIGNIPAC